MLVVTSIDRLGRNYTEILEQWKLITININADIKVLDIPLLDTTGDGENIDRRFIADLTLQILAYMAEKERVNIRARQRQGIDVMPIVDGKRVSLKTGKPTGRPSIDFPQRWEEIYKQWVGGEITATEAMKVLGLKRTTFYKLVRKYKQPE